MKTENLIEQIVEILQTAGRSLLENRFNGKISGYWEKSQFKTNADLETESLIINELSKLPLSIPIVTEEDKSSHIHNRPYKYWLIDPIDGTASYSEGYSGFVSQIALMQDMRPVISAVYAPAQSKLYLAERGSGATLNGTRMQLTEKEPDKIVLVDNYPEPKGIAKLIFKSLCCSDYIESGSIGLKICLVAENQANLFVKDIIFRDWDIAPGNLILDEAGGVLCDFDSNPIIYNGSLEKNNGLIAASSRMISNNVINVVP